MPLYSTEWKFCVILYFISFLSDLPKVTLIVIDQANMHTQGWALKFSPVRFGFDLWVIVIIIIISIIKGRGLWSWDTWVQTSALLYIEFMWPWESYLNLWISVFSSVKCGNHSSLIGCVGMCVRDRWRVCWESAWNIVVTQ